ncbi:MAG: ATP-binding protein [Anaerolineales bacterium]|jgi:signal transduction histidine kinase/DNA-binding response OmpR family regulator|nr:ATP-binding protein [Anaerolineales bacterium]
MRPSPSQSSANILIISDKPESAGNLQSELVKLDFPIEVTSILPVQEALGRLKDDCLLPDLVLLNIEEPDKGGFELLAKLRADPMFRQIPVIVVTSSRISSKDVQAGIMLGAEDYVASPVEWRELSARIQAKLRVKQAQEALYSSKPAESELSRLVEDEGDLFNEAELAHDLLGNSLKALGAGNGHLLIFHTDGAVTHHLYKPVDISPWTKTDLKQALQNAGCVVAAITSRRGQIVEDASNLKRWVPLPNDPTQSVLVVPLAGKREVLGVIVLTQDYKDFFKYEHVQVLQAIANQAALALENAFLFNIERKRVNELVALHQLIHRVNQFEHSAELIKILASLVKQYLNYPAVSTWLVEDAEHLTACSVAGEANAPRFSLMMIAPQEAASTGRSASFSGSMDERTGDRFGIGQPPNLSSLAVPIRWKNRIGGVLAIHSQHTSTFQESDRILLETICAQVGIVLERIELYETLEQEKKREINQLMAINQLQNEFIATASHDLKNPIFAVLGYSDLLERVGTLNDTQREFLAHIRHAGRLMQDLVINLLDIARIESGIDLQREPVNLVELLARVIQEMRPQAQAREIALSIHTDEGESLFTLGDAARLHQAFRNILDNSIKYTRPGGRVEVLVLADEGQAEVTFRDNGIGIPAEALPHIFERFYRVHTDLTRDIDGNGLGLAAVKSIIEHHGGNISVESVEGEGSSFQVKLKRH